MVTPLHKNPCPGIMKFTPLVDPSLVIITIHLVFVWTMLRRREDDLFKKYINFTLSTLKMTSPLSVGHEIDHFLSSCPTNFVKIGSIVLEKKTDDARWTTTDDDGRQLIAISHLSDSGDLKYELHNFHMNTSSGINYSM